MQSVNAGPARSVLAPQTGRSRRRSRRLLCSDVGAARTQPQSVLRLSRFCQRIREEARNRLALVGACAAVAGVQVAALFKLIELGLRHQNRSPKEAALAALAMPVTG